MERGMGGPTQVTNVIARLNVRILKEPRGFIRCVQLLIAIFALSTTSGFSTHVSYKLSCDVPADPTEQQVELAYPFNLEDTSYEVCGGKEERLIGDFSSSARYFVATGWLSLLYCIGILVVYLLYNHMYDTNQLVPAADLVGTTILVIFWLTSASAWAAGVSDLKTYGDPEVFLKECNEKCIPGYRGNFASLNVSLILGFASFLLWGASLWFVYKETVWFRNRQAMMNPVLPPQGPPPSTM